MKETRPRITITAERHDKLLEAERRCKEIESFALELCEQTLKLIHAFERRGKAARRLVRMHKAKQGRWRVEETMSDDGFSMVSLWRCTDA